MASKIKKSEWKALYIVTGAIDVFQIVIDVFLTELFGGPEILNEFIDAGVGAGLLVYFQLRGVSMFKKLGRISSMLGMEALTDLTGGAASFWILEVLYIHRTVKMEDAQRQQEQTMQFSVNQPSNVNGVRQPSTQTGTQYGSYTPGAPNTGTTTGTGGSNNHISTYNVGPLNVDGVRLASKQPSGGDK